MNLSELKEALDTEARFEVVRIKKELEESNCRIKSLEEYIVVLKRWHSNELKEKDAEVAALKAELESAILCARRNCLTCKNRYTAKGCAECDKSSHWEWRGLVTNYEYWE